MNKNQIEERGKRIAIASNAVAWAMWGTGDVDEITVSSVQLAIVQCIAENVIDDLDEYANSLEETSKIDEVDVVVRLPRKVAEAYASGEWMEVGDPDFHAGINALGSAARSVVGIKS